MKQQLADEHRSERSEVLQLIERRSTVQGWLARLDEQKGRVSERVLEKVRGDYQIRLQETLDALATHRRSIQDELGRASDRLLAAEEDHQAALDELEEGRLRNSIGEIDDSNWGAREAELAEAVERASASEVAVREETRRLEELLGQLEERGPASTPTFSVEPLEVVTKVDRGSASWLDEPDEMPPPGRSEPLAHAPLAGLESHNFLSDIDRAVIKTPEQPGLISHSLESDEPVEDTAPKPGLKCAECGYTNDLSAWFCGVCGADVG
jgi:hypothetical protein